MAETTAQLLQARHKQQRPWLLEELATWELVRLNTPEALQELAIRERQTKLPVEELATQ